SINSRRTPPRSSYARPRNRSSRQAGSFFFSSRRRHTRWPRDWSSDVCSSDLLGDMDFIKIPYAGLLSKEYAAERRKLIDQGTASLAFRPGTAEKFTSSTTPLDRPLKVTTAGDGDHDGDTSYIAVVDGSRNMITFTPSLHSAFGT